jgi:hypothetical protein
LLEWQRSLALPETGHIAGKTQCGGIDERATRRRSMMRRFTMTIAAALGAGLVGVPASAQEMAQQPIQDIQTTPQTGPAFYAPFVWNGNALDQKILDAQAQMLPPRRLIGPHRRHHHHG